MTVYDEKFDFYCYCSLNCYPVDNILVRFTYKNFHRSQKGLLFERIDCLNFLDTYYFAVEYCDIDF